MQLIWCLLSNFISTFTVHTACIPAPHSHSHHYQCRTPYAAMHTIVLLMMGIMMPETCWDSLIINIRLVASCWFFSLHPKVVRFIIFCILWWKASKEYFEALEQNIREWTVQPVEKIHTLQRHTTLGPRIRSSSAHRSTTMSNPTFLMWNSPFEFQQPVSPSINGRIW